MLAVANHRERVILLVLLTSGMRAQALVQLQIRDFEPLPDNVGHFVVYARTRDYYHTFCTPECTAAIQFYLNWRKEMGEEIKPEAALIRDSIKDGFSKKTKMLCQGWHWRSSRLTTEMLVLLLKYRNSSNK